MSTTVVAADGAEVGKSAFGVTLEPPVFPLTIPKH